MHAGTLEVPRMTRYGDNDRQLGKLIAADAPPRQEETLLYLAHDLTDKEIAQQMGISPRTVNKLRAELNYKCGTHTGPGLITRAFELGYLRFASIALAWFIGAGTFSTPAPAHAYKGPVATSETEQKEPEALRFRSRRTSRYRSNQRLRTRTRTQRNTRSRNQALAITPLTCNWCEETSQLFIDNTPLTEITGATQ